MDCVVLAGGRCPDDLRDASGCEYRADLMLGDRRMVEIVVDAIDPICESGDRIIVVGAHVDGRECLPAGDSFLESLRTGIEAASSGHVLIATGDVPFLTTEAVRDFIDRSDLEAMLNWPIVPTEVCGRKYPNMRRTSIKVREGRFTGGNVALIRREEFVRVYPTLEAAYGNRKKPLRLAAQAGFGTLLRVAFGQVVPASLPLAALEDRVGSLLGARVRAVVTQFAEVGADIDSLEQWRAAQNF